MREREREQVSEKRKEMNGKNRNNNNCVVYPLHYIIIYLASIYLFIALPANNNDGIGKLRQGDI